ncbi:intermembrane transport protein PqiB [Luteolibacter pohnpeiensis]|uniref:Intermembrane transport protein PqiB n=1 Tax=Luteolibacter pohnpeiensis TaxID=454153 RepID=A0A934VUU9_9BACT|nr:intermembrane transport protein PqiB [Luteolibacter pohnpeiensis]MBK1880879.1 intermembrane transport protein PqiB [Luteolibacter pohnpeiensis]
MTETKEPVITPATPEYKAAQRWNIIWVVPILAILIGGYLVYRSFASQGPLAEVRFETADGIIAGQTEVRCRSVLVGKVEDVKLSKDLKSVMISLRIDPESESLLRDGTQFWVVRPRVSVSDISGLGTLITGAYIELDPGSGGELKTSYIGRETPPATSRSIPGRRLVLTADEAGSLMPGSPIYYRGYEVGRIESRRLDIENRQVVYEAFVREEYAGLVRRNTRFWNTSGVDVSVGTDGFKVRTPSLQAMVSGGAEFGIPDSEPAGAAVTDGASFVLHKSFDDAVNSTFLPSMKFLLLFDQSVRGLAVGAPVEFRGIQLGRVADISFNHNPVRGDRRIPVVIEIDPALLRSETRERLDDPEYQFLGNAVEHGMRAALKTGNLLSGALFVDLDYYPEAPSEEITMTGDLKTLPTISSGFAQLESKVTAILDKLEALPLDETVEKITKASDEAATTIADARETMHEIEQTLAAARETLEDPAFRDLPSDLKKTLNELQESVASVGPNGEVQGDLRRTLDELRASLRSIKSLTNTIDEKPSSLIFGKESSGNPIPRAPKK